jgi:hypothetical protein
LQALACLELHTVIGSQEPNWIVSKIAFLTELPISLFLHHFHRTALSDQTVCNSHSQGRRLSKAPSERYKIARRFIRPESVTTSVAAPVAIDEIAEFSMRPDRRTLQMAFAEEF